jgi:hypothetical protein
MKQVQIITLLALMFLTLTLKLQAQSHSTIAGGGIGYSTKNSPATDLVIGIQFENNLLIQGNLIAHTQDWEDYQKAVCIKGGYAFIITEHNDIELAAGYAYNMRSSVWKIKNSHSPTFSMTFVNHTFKVDKLLKRGRISHQTGQFYFSVSYIDRAVIGAVGIRLHVKRERTS